MNHRTQNPEALAGIPIHIVAEIGAKLQTTDSDPVASIRMAYALLDAAEAGRRSLQDEGCVDPGLLSFDIERRKESTRPRILAEYKSDPLYQEKDGRPAPVPFENALAIVFGKSIKKTEREKRLSVYLAEKDEGLKTMFANLPQELNPFTIAGRPTAAENLQAWKTEGIPWGEYQDLKRYFSDWWKDRLSRTQAAKRKGKTKGNQGRVIRKNDKRKGSKAGSFLKALKKTS